MPNIRFPRAGSMQYWPRKRARRHYARVRSWSSAGDKGLLGFAGYKVGMTHVLVMDTRKTSLTKGMEIVKPVTILECPPLKVAGVRLYKTANYGVQPAQDIISTLDKECGRKICLPKKSAAAEMDKINTAAYTDVTLIVYTQPKLTGRGNKTPEIFEMGIAGSVADKLAYAKDHFGKEIKIEEAFKEGQQVDIHAITKGHGFQGPVKRFGVHLRQHKAEKTKRGPASLGAWNAQGHMMYRVAHAGQMGFHQRTDYNKRILKIDTTPSAIAKKGGFHKYGTVRNSYLLLEGSVPGARNRIIRFTRAIRPQGPVTLEVQHITAINITRNTIAGAP